MIKANTIRDEICFLARSKYHYDYVHGCFGPESFDCAGYVWYIYNKILGIDIFKDGYGLSTTTMIMTSKYGKLTLYDKEFKNISIIKKGDIVFLHRQSLNDNVPKVDNKYPGHCGIYLGDNKFIHASGTKKKIIINTFNSHYWYTKLVGSKDIVNEYEKILK